MDNRYDHIQEVAKFNPYHDARGRFATAGNYSSFTYKPGKSKAHDLAIQRMQQRQQAAAASKPAPAKPKASKPATTKPAASTSTKKPAAAAHSPSKPKITRDKRGFADHDSAGYHKLHSGAKYYAQQNLSAKEKSAVNNYLQAHTEPGSLYSHSQNMNWKMANGQKLTGQYKQTHDGMMSAMHNIGYNVELTRYDHAGMINSVLKKTGAGSNYENMTQSQLKKALVGQTVGEKKFISTTYNDFSKVSQSQKQVFTSRAVKINYKVKANTQAMMPGKGPGGDFGEIVLAPTNGTGNKPGKITDVRFTGQMARRQGTQTYNQPQIEITIELG